MKEPIYKVSCIVIGSKCTVMRSTSQFFYLYRVTVFGRVYHLGL